MPPTIVRGQWGRWGTGNFVGAAWKSPGGVANGIDFGSGPEIVPAGKTCGEYLGAQSQIQSAFTSWTTAGTYDPIRREFRTMCTSGHGNWASNEVNVLKWATADQGWNVGGRPVDPSVGLFSKYNVNWPAGTYFGGTNQAVGPPGFWDLANRYTAGAKVPPGYTHALWPNSGQQYGGLIFMPSVGRYLLWQLATWWQPGTGNVPFEFDPATNQYDGIIEQSGLTYDGLGTTGCWDSTNNRALLVSHTDLFAYYPGQPRASRYVRIASNIVNRLDSSYSTTFWDPVLLRMQFIGGGESYALSFTGGPNAPVKVQPPWDFSQPVFTDAPMAVYDPISHLYFVWNGRGATFQSVFWMNPTTGAITREDPPATGVPTSAGDLGTNPNSGGIWNRGFYEPTDDVFVVIGNAFTQGFEFFAPRRAGATVTRIFQESVAVIEKLDKVETHLPAPGAPPIVNINLTQPPGLSASIRRAGGAAIPPQLVQESLVLSDQLVPLKIPVPTGIPPVLLFSTLIQGPKTGNSDTSHGAPLNQDGAWVSIYGRRISSLDFVLRIGGAVAATIYRGPAIPPYSMATLQNGVQNYELVVAQVSHLATDGAGSIVATVDGVASNALPFTVAPGTIRYCAGPGTGSNPGPGNSANPGTWQAPFRFPSDCVTTAMQPGDITYCCTGADQAAGCEVPNSSTYDNANLKPMAVVGYPGHTVTLGSPTADGLQFNASKVGYQMTYANLRLTGHGQSTYIVFVHGGSRCVANYITSPAGTGKAAAIGGDGSQLQIVGNECTQVGDVSQTDPEFHVIYLAGARGRGAGWFEETDREVAYNFLHECTGALRAVNIYNGEPSGYGNTAEGSNPISNHRVHDNYIRGQHGSAIAFLTGVVGQNSAWNNVIERTIFTTSGGLTATSYDTLGIRQRLGWDPARYPAAGNVLHCRNNTVIDCGAGGNFSGAFIFETNYGWTPDFHSNVSYQVNGQPHTAPGDSNSPTFTPATGQGHHNVWYGAAKPPWDLTGVTGNPLFVAAGSPLNPRLQAGSSARNAGAVLGAGQIDMDGVPRPASAACDAGAFQYA